VIGGPYLLGLPLAAAGERVEVTMRGEKVELLDCGDFVLLPRHGLDAYTRPHLIDHAANLRALRELGCSRVLAIGSVGSLRPELGVGTFVLPDDFIAFGPSQSAFADERSHIVPAFDDGWRRHVRRAWGEWAGTEIVDGGVYFQSAGPRLETRAEIRLIAQVADVIGMTIPGECVIACELHMRYAAVCIVDNLANGVADRRLTIERLEAGRANNSELLETQLAALVPPLAEEISREVEVPTTAQRLPHFHREHAPEPESTEPPSQPEPAA
jgi:5'-methylthioadenosine phosphorylase